MSIDIFEKEKTISLEVFPPKKDDEFESAFQVLDEMGKLAPDYISVTYGAGGSRAGKTVEIASYIQNKLNIPAITHITCVGNTPETIDAQIKQLEDAGIHHILALRGDKPRDMEQADYDNRYFTYASNLTAYVKEHSKLRIAGACYPEKHYDSFSMETDIRNLKIKQEAGAEYLITQLFFDNDYFYRFQDRARQKGITVPISAGIMPITSPKQIGTTVTLSGSSIPKAFSDLIAKYGENPEEMRKAGIDYAIRQIQDLMDNDVNHIHLYSMNKPKTTAEIIQAIRG